MQANPEKSYATIQIVNALSRLWREIFQIVTNQHISRLDAGGAWAGIKDNYDNKDKVVTVVPVVFNFLGGRG